MRGLVVSVVTAAPVVAAHGDPWLIENQEKDGRWPGAHADADLVSTSLAMLAILSDGTTVRSGPYRPSLIAAARWMSRRVHRSGRLVAPHGHHDLYGQAVGTYALIETAELSKNKALRKKALLAFAYLTSGPNRARLWGRRARCGDGFARAWTLRAALSARHFKWRARGEVEAAIRGWLSRASRLADPEPLTRANRMWARLLLAPGGLCAATRADAARMELPVWKPKESSTDPERWYLCATAVFQVGGRSWKRMRAGLRATVLRRRVVKTGASEGSWPPVGRNATTGQGGRAHTTACGVMCTTLYYRYCHLQR